MIRSDSNSYNCSGSRTRKAPPQGTSTWTKLTLGGLSHAGVRTGGQDGLSDAGGTGHVCDGSEAGGKRRTTDGFQTGRVDQKNEVVSQPLGDGKGTEAHAQGQPRLDIVS